MRIYKHNYKKSYFELFNKITEIIEMLILIQIESGREFIADEHNDEDQCEDRQE